MEYQHKTLALGRWHTFTLAEQFGNIGSEISRARQWEGKDAGHFEQAIFRALELLDITLADPRWIKAHRLKEIARVREVVCDAYLGGHEYGSTLVELDRYFFEFALAARARR